MIIPSWLRLNTRSFILLLLGLFLVRGIQIQCLYPPLEGPDEYQHIAYLVYLNEEHHPPVYGQAWVPLSLYPNLVANPHSDYDWQQTKNIGTLRYEEFYDNQPVVTSDTKVALYQAQHPPLYYELVSPLFIWIQNTFGFRDAVYALRLLNIGLAGLAMLGLLTPLRFLFKDDGLFRPVALAISLSPMFMIYVSRIANDALALAFVGAAVYLLMRLHTARWPHASALLVGSLLGLGTLAKMITVSLLPVALVYLLFMASCGKSKWRTVGISALALIGAYLAFALPYFVQNIQLYGMPLISQETIRNARNGKSLLDSLREIRAEHLRIFLVQLLVEQNLWLSGWSFLRPDKLFVAIYSWILVIGLGGLTVGGYRILAKRASIPAASASAVVLSVLLVIFSALAAYAHALSALVAFHGIVTPPYYVMVGYPAFLICIFAAARGYGRIAVPGLATALGLLFLVTEYHSLLWIAAPYWAHTPIWAAIVNRLGSLHPVFLPSWLFSPLAVLVILLAAFLALSNWLVYSHETAVAHIPPSPSATLPRKDATELSI